MSTALNSTFTTTTQSASFVSPVGVRELAMGLDFSGTGSVNLEIKLGGNWYIIETFTTDIAKLVSVPGSKTCEYRLNCTARSADILYYLGT